MNSKISVFDKIAATLALTGVLSCAIGAVIGGTNKPFYLVGLGLVIPAWLIRMREHQKIQALKTQQRLK
jgi:predicted branched-subunit amino acid permease